jgi:hypothetical protein
MIILRWGLGIKKIIVIYLIKKRQIIIGNKICIFELNEKGDVYGANVRFFSKLVFISFPLVFDSFPSSIYFFPI